MVDVAVPELVITSLAEAPRVLLSKSLGPRVSCIVSIGDPGEKVPAGYSKVRQRLRLEISDIADDDETGVMPQRAHVEQLLRFTDVLANESGLTLFHCQAGISRSTAAAFTVLAKVMGPGRELAALDEVLRVRSIAFPNKRIVEIADALLERRGAMRQALVTRGVLLTKD